MLPSWILNQLTTTRTITLRCTLTQLTTQMKTLNATEIDSLVVPFNADGTINKEPETEEDNNPLEPLSTTVLEETEVVFEVFKEGSK
ncbi:hypothetical protein DPMN_001843 [Dreissena polymorpha]|uniref:Uncharacterized protein n=1 Tax=Dreissena polymorpha TaxID=45954 RepID=A0A9D4RR76_DREPO|nr:hypothetical protein DPMN_001843 [Dreissena polymorpha]